MKTMLIMMLMFLIAGRMQLSGEGVMTFQSIDGVSVTAIQDTASRMSAKLFSSPQADYPYDFDWPSDWEASVNVFLVRTGGRIYLIDAGNAPEKGTLAGKLQSAGVAPEQVSGVLITHIHPDHVGGLLTLRDGAEVPLFPQATVYIAQEEYSAWEGDAGRQALARFLLPYRERLRLFAYSDLLPDGFSARKAAGHTPGHTVYVLGRKWFIGDIVHAAGLQFEHPVFCARYDRDPALAVETRTTVLRVAAQQSAVLLGAHIPFPGIGIVSGPEPRHHAARGTETLHFRFQALPGPALP
ncbi:MAG: MBL fold metallo-hydrolase [Oligosphaeraceae bacterium]|nr:MBL fold metallo-hydrolase [Oligosphaeraceae bacterium]